MNPTFQTISLKCPSCGASLNITSDMDMFACGYCGVQQMVQRNGGTVSLKLIGEAIAKVQIGTDRTAAELAIRRLRDDLAGVEVERERLNLAIAGGETITGYLVIAFIALLVAVITCLFSRIWIGACIAATFATFVAFRTNRNIKACERMIAYRNRTIDIRTQDLRSQLTKHLEVVSS